MILCQQLVLTYCGVSSDSDSEFVHRNDAKVENLDRILSSQREVDDTNGINYEVYVTPVMSQYAKLRSRNPLLSWLANVLTFGGGQPEEQEPVVGASNCPKCSKYANLM